MDKEFKEMEEVIEESVVEESVDFEKPEARNRSLEHYRQNRRKKNKTSKKSRRRNR